MKMYRYAHGRWKQVFNTHKHHHVMPYIRDLTEKQIDRLMRSQTKL